MTGDLLSKFHNDAVVNDAINRGSRGHRVFENFFPLGKDQVGCDDDAAPFVTPGEHDLEARDVGFIAAYVEIFHGHINIGLCRLGKQLRLIACQQFFFLPAC